MLIVISVIVIIVEITIISSRPVLDKRFHCPTALLSNVPCRGEGDGGSVHGKGAGREGEGDWSANRQRSGPM